MELEAKLDEDFLFYLNFTDTFLKRIHDPDVMKRAKIWLHKLIGEPCEGIQRKRCRNMYLSNLLVCMQNGILDKPFTQSPYDVDITNATDVFGPIPSTVEPPEWLNDSILDTSHMQPQAPRQGRTYVATRTLPNGQGAFAYIGVSLTNEEPMWLGAGESSFDARMEEKFTEMVPMYEMEKILSRRKDPVEREKVLAFYDALLQHIADELDGKETAENETVEGLLTQLVEDLREKEQYQEYEELENDSRRIELLLLLFDRIKIRRDKVARREELLDEIQEKVMPKSFFDVSEPSPEDRNLLPAAMWETAIDKYPNKKNMEKLLKAYPLPLVKKFVQYLCDYKELIAMRMHRRHENIVAQMKKELRKEGEKMKKVAEESEKACENAVAVLDAVKARHKLKTDAEKKQEEEALEEMPEHSKVYEKMKEAMYDTQKKVEEEALRGKFLAAQINSVNEQTEQFVNISDDIIKKTEEQNMKTLRNIKKLTGAIKQYEGIIQDIRSTTQGAKSKFSSQMVIV